MDEKKRNKNKKIKNKQHHQQRKKKISEKTPHQETTRKNIFPAQNLGPKGKKRRTKRKEKTSKNTKIEMSEKQEERSFQASALGGRSTRVAKWESKGTEQKASPSDAPTIDARIAGRTGPTGSVVPRPSGAQRPATGGAEHHLAWKKGPLLTPLPLPCCSPAHMSPLPMSPLPSPAPACPPSSLHPLSLSSTISFQPFPLLLGSFLRV